jgi:hypothetical protein
MNDAMIGTEGGKFFGCKFSPTISTKDLDWKVQLGFNHGFKLLENNKGV